MRDLTVEQIENAQIYFTVFIVLGVLSFGCFLELREQKLKRERDEKSEAILRKIKTDLETKRIADFAKKLKW